MKPKWLILFLQSPDSVNATIDGRKPIHYASDFGQTAVIDYLISKGAEVNVSTCLSVASLSIFS